MRPLPLVLALVLVLLAGLCARMGLWQHERWQEARAANAALASALAANPAPLARADELAGLAGRKVEAVGEWDTTRHVLLSRESANGEMGVQVVTPLRLSGGQVLVDRGWIAAQSAAAVRPSEFTPGGEARVRALVQPLAPRASRLPWVRLDAGAPERWSTLGLDADTLAARLSGVDSRSLLLALPEGASAPLTRSTPLPADAKVHASYVFQWGLFSIASLAGAAFVLTRRPRRRA